MYYMECGCVFEGYIYISMDCECCGRDYDIQDARITQACEAHGG